MSAVWRMRWAAVGLVAVVAVAACGGGDGGEDAAAPAKKPADAPATAAAKSKAAAPDNSCKLTVDEVASVFGVPMRLDGYCSFFPVADAVNPNASYNRQHVIALNADVLAEEGFTQAVPGVGDKAYAKSRGSTWLRVKVGDRIFEVMVAAGAPEVELEAAKKLAAFVLDD